MFCSKCGGQVPEGSAFCNKCGAPTAADNAAPAASPAPAGGAAPEPALTAPAPSSQEPEEELWKGRCSIKAWGHLWILWVLWMGGLVFAYFKIRPESGYTGIGHSAYLALAGLPFLFILWSWLSEWLGTRYRLTNYRLFKETGILSRSMNELELLRVDDVSVRQNIIQRIFNVGIVTVISPTDATEPRLELRGIQNPVEVKEQIRTHVRKRRERSLHVESL